MINELTLAMVAEIGLRTLASVIHADPDQAWTRSKGGGRLQPHSLIPPMQSLLRRWLQW